VTEGDMPSLVAIGLRDVEQVAFNAQVFYAFNVCIHPTAGDDVTDHADGVTRGGRRLEQVSQSDFFSQLTNALWNRDVGWDWWLVHYMKCESGMLKQVSK
jgi:hypothetical protein